MRRYWDLNDSEKRALTHEDVRAFINIELMTEGIVVPPVPVDPKTAVPDETVKTSVFRVSQGYRDLCTFSTLADAEAFTHLAVISTTNEYLGKNYSSPSFAVAEPVSGDFKIEPVQIRTIESVRAYKAKYAEALGKQEAYEADLKAYREADKKADAVRDAIWSDYHDIKAKQAEFDRILEVRADYLRMADNNAAVAETFLRKAYSGEEVDAALAYGGIASALPLATEPEPASA